MNHRKIFGGVAALLLFASVAQPVSAQRVGRWMFNGQYSTVLGVEETADFAGDFSFRGVTIDVKRVQSENLALGVTFGWHVLDEQAVEGTNVFPAGAITGTRYKYVNSVPILAIANYYLGSAGTGVRHSEANPSKTEPVHLLQIWIEPARVGLEPGYEQKAFGEEDKRGRLRLVASPDGAEGSVTIHQDTRVYATLLDAGQRAVHRLAPGRQAWVHVARGSLTLDGERLAAGDGAAVSGESSVTLVGEQSAEALLFDLA